MVFPKHKQTTTNQRLLELHLPCNLEAPDVISKINISDWRWKKQFLFLKLKTIIKKRKDNGELVARIHVQ